MLAALSRSLFRVGRERPGPAADRRAEPRLRALGNAYLRIGRRDVPLIDWSRGGFCAQDAGDFAAGQFARFRVYIHGIQDPDPALSITVDAAILRIRDDRVAGRWLPVSRSDAKALAVFAARKAADRRWLIPTELSTIRRHHGRSAPFCGGRAIGFGE